MDESAPVPYENEAVRAWLKEQGFHEGDLRSGVRVSGRTGKTSVMEACFQGEVSVCKWLHDHGADIVKADNGLSDSSAYRSLGWLWSMPRSTLTPPLDGVGLGQSITWALDPEACGKLLPTLDSEVSFIV